ncbi:hypothetical protein [Quatrionicoccus australiensis]|uniref:hypothetical protein n=1 Tax=Quatrionicoccus australiensis TaxID=138118 RepID=UPI001CF92B7B|nr:hypothetical protein [Quatrionicoccus australiensis]UCV13437.1 hypothetical protein KI612_10665 [Quatrionicoccus australiensis]
MKIIDIMFWMGIIAIPIAGVLHSVDVYRNPNRYLKWVRRRYQEKFDSHPVRDTSSLIEETKIELAARRLEIDSIELEIERLSLEKNRTRAEIFALTDRLRLVGLAENNRRKWMFDLFLGFLVGLMTSVLGSMFWQHIASWFSVA